MKKFVMFLAVVMTVGVLSVGCSHEKKEEAKPAATSETNVNKANETAPAAMVDKAKETAGAAAEKATIPPVEGAKEPAVAPPAAPQTPEPAAGVAGQVQGAGQAGAGAVQDGANVLKEETDKAVEAMPQGAGAPAGEAPAPAPAK